MDWVLQAILPLKYLKILVMSENNIRQMEADDFKGESFILRVLEGIRWITTIRVGMESLDELTLNHNKLEHLGAGFFRGLNSLTTLYNALVKVSAQSSSF